MKLRDKNDTKKNLNIITRGKQRKGKKNGSRKINNEKKMEKNTKTVIKKDKRKRRKKK